MANRASVWDHWPRRRVAALLLLAGVSPPSALAQSNACVLEPDKYSPGEQILRCGTDLTVQPAPGTVWHPPAAGQAGPPPSLRLDSGALLSEFHPSDRRRNFEILTPLAIASVRGTKWAVEATPGRTSVLVLAGEVNVAGTAGASGVELRPGQGVDVTQSAAPLQVRTWPVARVKALLARFGQ